jgi:hypothetical protein
MNDVRLAATVSDWLKTTDTPPANVPRSRSSAVALARTTPQVRARVWRWSWPRPRSPLSVAAPAALIVLVAVLIVGVLAWPQSPGPELAPAQAGGPSPTGDALLDTALESVDASIEEPTSAASQYRGDRDVAVGFGDTTLTGRVWPDGTVRILEDGAGNATDLVDRVVVAPDDTVWVARNMGIFALGEEGKYRPPVGESERRWRIIDLVARPDGSLDVLTWHALWHFDDGIWTQLPTPPEIAHESDLDGYYPDRMPDGSVWTTANDPALVARYTDEGWVEYPLAEIMPKTFGGRPGKQVRVDIDGAHEGSIWIAVTAGGTALARFDGATWTEYPEPFLTRVLGHEPEPVSDILTSTDGTTWILLGVDGAARDIVRVQGDDWSATPVRKIRREAGAGDEIPFQWLAEAAEDGAVQLYAGEDQHRAALWWDGRKAVLQEFGVFSPVGRTSDGTLWGIGRNKDVGLLMRPAD